MTNSEIFQDNDEKINDHRNHREKCEGKIPPVIQLTGINHSVSVAQWFEQHRYHPPPTHSPAMLANTNMKWRRGLASDWGKNLPVHGLGYTQSGQDLHRDDSSEDSYHSTTSSGNITRNSPSPLTNNDFYGLPAATLVRFQPPAFPRYHDQVYEKQRNFFGGWAGGRWKQRMFKPRPQHSPNGHIPPDRFLHHSHLVHIDKTPAYINNTDGLSKSIWNRFMMSQQTVETYKQKIMLWKDLFILIRSAFPKYGLFLVGSTMSGLGTNSSDVDMCLMVRCLEMDQRNDALLHLGQIANQLRQSNFATNVDMIHAKVPILKLRSRGLEIDLNCNNCVGIRNTHLLYSYSQMDWRVRPLVVVVKLWASHHNINDAKRMTVSSYSWALMVIHYLQCGVEPKVVPCLQQQYPDKFATNIDINNIDLHETLPEFHSENKHSLSKLLLGFLQYYKDFNYSEYAVSVRIADRIPIDECRHARSVKNDPNQWKYLCIEEPFDRTNTARSVYDYATFERVRRVVQASYERLKSSRRLDSLFERNFQPY